MEQERATRQRTYVWTMAFRTLMFIVAISVPMPVWLRITLIFSSMILPWIAVMAANQPHQRLRGQDVPGFAKLTPAAVEVPRLDAVRIVDGDRVAGPAGAEVAGAASCRAPQIIEGDVAS
jgi:hypothetical protein